MEQLLAVAGWLSCNGFFVVRKKNGMRTRATMGLYSSF